MNPMESVWSSGIQPKVHLWWASKTKQEKLAIELHSAILAPTFGTLIGMLFILLI